MRHIYQVQLDTLRPALLLTRERSAPYMNAVTVAAITSTVHGTVNELPVGPANGLPQACVVNLDDVHTVPREALGRVVGFLLAHQEDALREVIMLSYELAPPT